MLNLEIGPLRIEGDSRVFVDGHEVRLAERERRLLLHVARRRGQLCLRYDLVATGKRASRKRERAAVPKGMQKLRRKLGMAAGLLETVRGLGYRLAG